MGGCPVTGLYSLEANIHPTLPDVTTKNVSRRWQMSSAENRWGKDWTNVRHVLKKQCELFVLVYLADLDKEKNKPGSSNFGSGSYVQLHLIVLQFGWLIGWLFILCFLWKNRCLTFHEYKSK